MKKKIAVCFIALWAVLLVGLGGYYVFAAPREEAYSESENRMLSAMPEISLDSFFRSELSDGMERYLLDRFPGRDRVIPAADAWKDMMSVASYEDYLAMGQGSADDPLDTGDYQTGLDDLVGQLGQPTPTPEVTPTGETQPPVVSAGPTPTPEPKEFPAIQPKPPADQEDYPDTLGVYAEIDGATYTYRSYAKQNVLAVTALLNQYAALLPEGGKLLFTMVPQSVVGNRFVNSSRNGRFYSDYSDVINAFGADNVYAFDTPAILSDAMQEEQYVYFRSDMHWTPYGSYLVYREMALRAGKVPCDYDDDFDHTMEEPFLGTYYRDNPTSYMREHADSLDLLMPKFPFEWRRIVQGDEYKLIDFLDWNARANDRYTVYLGGPAGPWTYTDSDNGEEENCLVLTDSFGLGFMPFVTTNYKQVHYYDPRYFDQGAVGASVAELIEKHQIRDIYVVVGDLHSFDSGFLLTTAREQLGADQ